MGRRSIAGDTIVEVLIALAVLGAIIGAGYSIATRSLNGVQIANERSEATKIAEGQFEAMRAASAKAASLNDLAQYNPTINSQTDQPFAKVSSYVPMAVDESFGLPPGTFISFCFAQNGEVKRFDMASLTLSDIHSSVHQYPAECIYDNRYYVGFEMHALPGASSNQLEINAQVTWDKSGGGLEPEKVVLSDRLVF